jgi:colanic acid/amylovoran biosynthesis protein
MRILLEPGSYTCLNLGDVAMMQVALSRLSSLWPQAQIQIVTQSPGLLQTYCPQALPVPLAGKRAWLQARLLGRFHRSLRYALGQRADLADAALRRRMPGLATRLLAWKMRVRNLAFAEVRTFLDSILNADLMVVSGSGVFADPFCERALQLMDTLAMAQQLAIPCVMFSQGFGPVENPELASAMRQVLPGVRQIGIRESVCSPEILAAAAVPPVHIRATGDDALEMALDHSGRQAGTAIGINLRMTAYSGLTPDLVAPLRSVLKQAFQKYQAAPIPIPILRRNDEDLRASRMVLPETSVMGTLAEADTPCKAIRLTARCRLVITSSYHAAVFALGQGIPAIGLVRSQYYAHKFAGLHQQFGEGCTIVRLDETGYPEQLARGIEWAWNHAVSIREKLIPATRHLVECSQAAYRQVPAFLCNAPRQVA